MRRPILNFLLLVLGIPLDLNPNAGHKSGGFSKAEPEKGLEFVPSRTDGIVAFNLSLVLLLAKVDLIPEKRGCKGYVLGARGSGCVKIGILLSAEVVALYVGATIV